MKSFFIMITGSILITGCDPAFSLYVENKTSDTVMLITRPALEKLPNESFTRIMVERRRRYGPNDTAQEVYIFYPHEKQLVFANMGIAPSRAFTDFEYIKVIRHGDTLTLDNEKEISKKIRQGITGKRTLVIK